MIQTSNHPEIALSMTNLDNSVLHPKVKVNSKEDKVKAKDKVKVKDKDKDKVKVNHLESRLCKTTTLKMAHKRLLGVMTTLEVLTTL